MAVFPDRIVLKNSTDTDAVITALIESGGSDEITQGELVLGLSAGSLTFYSVDSNGDIVKFSPTSASGRAIVSDTAPTVGVSGLPLADGDLWYESDTGNYYVYSSGTWELVSNSASGAGTVTSVGITVSEGLLAAGGPITTSGNISLSLDTTGVTPGNYTSANLEVDAYGRVVGIANGSGGGYTDPLTDNGDIVIRSGGFTTRLPIGTAGQVLTVQSGGPAWQDLSNGTVTSVGITSGSGDLVVTGSPITTSGTIGLELSNTGVTPGTYTSVNIEVDEKGRVVDISNGAGNGYLDPLTNNGDLVYRVGGVTANLPVGTNGQVLTVSSGLPSWQDSAAVGALSDLSDTTISSLSTGDLIRWNGSAWVNYADSAYATFVQGNLADSAIQPTDSIDSLADVDTTTTGPTDGQTLIWDSTAGKWEPGNVSGSGLVDSVNGLIGAVVLEIFDLDDVQSPFLTLNNRQLNSSWTSGVDTENWDVANISGTQPWFFFHTDLLSRFSGLNVGDSLTFSSPGISDHVTTITQVATQNSTSQYYIIVADLWPSQWLNIAYGGDVTVKNLPDSVNNGDALIYNSTSGKWEPGTATAPVDSVNGETGVVSLGIEDMDDFALSPVPATSSVTRTKQSGQEANVTSGNVGTSRLYLGESYWNYNPEGSGALNILSYLRDTAAFPIDLDINGTTVTVTSATDQPDVGGNGGSLKLQHPGLTNSSSITGTSWTLTTAAAATLPLAEGDILQYVSADSKFKPTQLGIDDLSDVDTTTVPPTEGQVLVWDSTAGQWEPGSAGVSSVSVLNDLTDVVAEGPTPTAISYATYSSDNTPEAGQWHINTSYLYLPKVDSDGVDQSANLRALSGEDLTITDSDGTQWSMTSVSIVADELDGTYERILLDSSEQPTINSGINKTGGITVSSSAFTFSPLPVPDGSLLQYDSASSQWEITDAPDTSIQGSSDFELNDQTDTFTWSTCIGGSTIGAGDVAGEWGGYEAAGNSVVSVKNEDDTTDRSVILSAIQAGDVIKVNGVDRTVTAVADFISLQGEMRITFSGTGYIDYTAGTNTLTMESADFATGKAPLADGDLLAWSSSESKFMPYQLTSLSRINRSVTTSTLADAASENVVITGTGKAGQLISIQTDVAAWVTLYCSQATRTSDASRLEIEDPAPGSGVLAEVITTSAETIFVTPAVNYFNLESTPVTEVYAKVVNKSGASNTVTVTLTILPTEA